MTNNKRSPRTAAKSRVASRSRPPQTAVPGFLAVRPIPPIVFINTPEEVQTISFRVSGFSQPLMNPTLSDPGDETAVFCITKYNLTSDILGQLLEVSFTYSAGEKLVTASGSLLITIESSGVEVSRKYLRIAYLALERATKPKPAARLRRS